MPVNITLKGIPTEVYGRLKSSAHRNHRSITSEAISLIDESLRPSGGWTPERLERARLLRESFGPQAFTAREISTAKRRGRR